MRTKSKIDSGLERLIAQGMTRPLSERAIAKACQCAPSYIHRITETAIEKMRLRLANERQELAI